VQLKQLMTMVNEKHSFRKILLVHCIENFCLETDWLWWWGSLPNFFALVNQHWYRIQCLESIEEDNNIVNTLIYYFFRHTTQDFD